MAKNIFVSKFSGFIDPAKRGKFKDIRQGSRKTWVQYLASFRTKTDLERAKRWYRSNLVNAVRTYKVKGGYELWGND